MQQWEYRMLYFGINLSAILRIARWELEHDGKLLRSEAEVTAYLNELGAEGWEIVSMVNGADHNGNITKIVAVLKRPKAA
jgi:hypothetical protein